jgi:hypothetical protein
MTVKAVSDWFKSAGWSEDSRLDETIFYLYDKNGYAVNRVVILDEQSFWYCERGYGYEYLDNGWSEGVLVEMKRLKVENDLLKWW